MIGFLVKTEDIVSEGINLSKVNINETVIGELINRPIVGQRCVVGEIKTKPVTSIINGTDDKVIFKTENGKYVLHYLSVDKLAILINKAYSYDSLNEKVASFYDEDSQDYDSEGGLEEIGELVIRKLGYL